MKTFLVVALLLCLPLIVVSQRQSQRRIFPYDYSIDDLPNGLRLVTVPTDQKNLVALYIVVSTGSRNEVEPGRSGYAHLFEHLMFRGSEHYTSEQRDQILKRAGASDNAYTTDDRTVFHEVFSPEDLDTVMQLEADRFKHLKYDQAAFKTETLAVLGEYNKNSSSPFQKLYEVLRETAFKKHTYSHTTMGYLRDVEDMPNQYDYSLQFYNRYYRPEYVTITLVGDVTRAKALELTKKYFGDWQRGSYVPDIPVEPPQTEARTAHVDWPSPTLPYLVVAFHGPAYSDEQIDKAALDLLAPIAFGENSELYQRLVLREQKVDFISPSFDDQMNPELFAIFARVKNPEDVDYVRDQILETFKRFTTELIPQKKLDETRSRLRYSTALALNSNEAIAGNLAPYIALRRTPDTINRLFNLYDRVTPEDIRAMAQKYFREQNRTIVSLTYKPGATAGGQTQQ